LGARYEAYLGGSRMAKFRVLCIKVGISTQTGPGLHGGRHG